MITHLLPALILIPLLGFVACLFIPQRWEHTLFSISTATIALDFILFIYFVYQWASGGLAPIFTSIGLLYTSQHYTFSFDFYFDTLSVVFFGTTTITTILVFVFSKYYMHRDPGFKRFYTTILLFFTGLSLIIFAGNFTILFLGWEFIGMSSVLLIAFYRDRFLPVRNALKVFSVYRIADALLLIAIWYAHQMFGRSINFSEFASVIAQHGNHLAVLGSLMLMVALIKSAQFPFSYWLPRAMEGPTTSSAIFYGALSVHMGLFLLLRTYPLWEGSTGLRIAIALIGLVTALVASSITHVQSSIKTQIAYASITQIGVMFIELAFGLQWLVLVHFVSNASLRAYQLLISPSIVSYLVHDQFFHFVQPPARIKNNLLGRLRATIYILGIKEWGMDTAVSHYVWWPLKSIGRKFAFLDLLPLQLMALGLFLTTIAVATTVELSMSSLLIISTAAGAISVLFYIRAYTTKATAKTAWNLIMLGHLFGALFLALAFDGNWKYLIMYGMGVVVAFILGHFCIRYLEVKGEATQLYEYHGVMSIFTKVGHVFFIVCLLFMAFPISPSFLGQDILLSFIPRDHAFQVVLFGFSYVLVGVSIMRLYAKVFFGSHKTNHHEIAYKSS
jgi:NADH-quinone oxidoreductase subunit L